MSIANVKPFDPFADVEDSPGTASKPFQTSIHIRFQKRENRKVLTTVQGLPRTFSKQCYWMQTLTVSPVYDLTDFDLALPFKISLSTTCS